MRLKTDYKDDILDLTQNTNRCYEEIQNQDGSISFSDVTVYEQEGDNFTGRDVNAITKALTDEEHGVSFQFGIDGNGDYGYIKDGETEVTPFRNRHTETITPNSRATVDMGLYHKKRYVDLSAVPNVNSATYTFPVNDTGATKDLGASNSYRYVNAQNVYNKGVVDGRSGYMPIPTATKNITANGNNQDVLDYAKVNVNVPFTNFAVGNMCQYPATSGATYTVDTGNNSTKSLYAWMGLWDDGNATVDTNIYLQGSNDGSNWYTLASNTYRTSSRTGRDDAVLTATSTYRYYRLAFDSIFSIWRMGYVLARW